MKFSIKDFFSKCNQTAHLLCIFTEEITIFEEILNGKLHFLCSVMLNFSLFIFFHFLEGFKLQFQKILEIRNKVFFMCET